MPGKTSEIFIRWKFAPADAAAQSAHSATAETAVSPTFPRIGSETSRKYP